MASQSPYSRLVNRVSHDVSIQTASTVRRSKVGRAKTLPVGELL